ncbi:hypothetical protein COL26_34205 [Bacillus thuringiensis]|uniref:Uncharacterized protein n=2 Tax=Bacillus thuringiensis TaxID=1428 RepID=A0ABD6RV97_BACTU|nr:hypothetical protein CN495_36585 [Bacillus thuringiensis]PEU69912.1 hypothetical protein CN411_33695 [Bacillus thuringiensis]PFH98351.1 hypothetical protein COI79_33480 [Bacillus thuringiensis]PFW17452.1 hypothetical protein COL26_34205 [Bacillus thuringiensis]PGY59051.1 hypothetical protein COE44_34280 [Bacillus thuringiensis]
MQLEKTKQNLYLIGGDKMGWEKIIEQTEMTTKEKLQLICDASLVQAKSVLVEVNSFAWMVRTIKELSEEEKRW